MSEKDLKEKFPIPEDTNDTAHWSKEDYKSHSVSVAKRVVIPPFSERPIMVTAGGPPCSTWDSIPIYRNTRKSIWPLE